MKQKMSPSSEMSGHLPGQEIRAEKGYEISGFDYKLYCDPMTAKVTGPGQGS